MELEKTFTPLEKSRMRLEVKVAQKDAAEAYQKVLQKYAKTLQVPGFRKGKAPFNVLESKYGPELVAEARGELVNQAVEEAIANEDRFHAPLIYSNPLLDGSPAFNPNEAFLFAVEYDVFPKAELKTLEGFEVEVPDVSVEEEDIQKELETIRDRNALIIDKEDDAAAEEGDIATVSYVEIGEDGGEVEGTKVQGRVLTLGKDFDRYDAEKIAIGMKKGETKEAEKAFPEAYPINSLAGKTVKIKITLDALKRKELPALDDELAQDVSEKYQTLDDLKSDIRKSFERALEDKITSIKEDALIEKIVEANNFDIPKSMIAAELEGRWHQLAERFRTTPAQLEKVIAGMNSSKESLYDDWRQEAEKNLKVRIAIETLIEQLEIDANAEDAEKEMERIAERSGVDIDEVKKHYAEPREKEYLIDGIKERRLFERLLEKSTVKKGEKQAFSELFSDNSDK